MPAPLSKTPSAHQTPRAMARPCISPNLNTSPACPRVGAGQVLSPLSMTYFTHQAPGDTCPTLSISLLPGDQGDTDVDMDHGCPTTASLNTPRIIQCALRTPSDKQSRPRQHRCREGNVRCVSLMWFLLLTTNLDRGMWRHGLGQCCKFGTKNPYGSEGPPRQAVDIVDNRLTHPHVYQTNSDIRQGGHHSRSGDKHHWTVGDKCHQRSSTDLNG